MTETRNEIPDTCPLDTNPSTPVKCAMCVYMRQIKWSGINYCRADRVMKGFPDYK